MNSFGEFIEEWLRVGDDVPKDKEILSEENEKKQVQKNKPPEINNTEALPSISRRGKIKIIIVLFLFISLFAIIALKTIPITTSHFKKTEPDASKKHAPPIIIDTNILRKSPIIKTETFSDLNIIELDNLYKKINLENFQETDIKSVIDFLTLYEGLEKNSTYKLILKKRGINKDVVVNKSTQYLENEIIETEKQLESALGISNPDCIERMKIGNLTNEIKEKYKTLIEIYNIINDLGKVDLYTKKKNRYK